LATDVVLLIDKNGDGNHEEASWDFKTDFDDDGMSDWEEINYVFEMYGWAGLYKANSKRWDLPHFQKTFGYTTPQLLAMVAAGRTINGYVNI
jgi:peptidoglycan L-alanyl-D-glutamate endopeptidase CwlK